MSDRISANIRRDTATSAIWKRDVAAMADDLRADLDQLLPQAGQRPRAHLKVRGSPWNGLGCSESARCGNGRFRRYLVVRCRAVERQVSAAERPSVNSGRLPPAWSRTRPTGRSPHRRRLLPDGSRGARAGASACLRRFGASAMLHVDPVGTCSRGREWALPIPPWNGELRLRRRCGDPGQAGG